MDKMDKMVTKIMASNLFLCFQNIINNALSTNRQNGFDMFTI